MSDPIDAAARPRVSRRKFLTTSALGAGAAATLGGGVASGAASAAAPPADVEAGAAKLAIRIAPDFVQSVNEAPVEFAFGGERGLSGAEIFARACKQEGLEFDTISKYRVPVVLTVYNNDAWGMITAANGPRTHHLYMFQENLRYEKIAEALGARGEYCTTQEQYADALKRAYKAAVDDKVSTLINCQSRKQFLSAKDFPPGTPRNVEPGVTAYAH